jgi:AraC-like DNA-binding protein
VRHAVVDATMLCAARGCGLNKRDMPDHRYQLKQDPHNGLLNFKASEPMSGYWRYFPSPDLAPFIEHYWTIEWNLPEPALRETLPYPSAHIILEPGVADLGGVHTRKFSRVLQGSSRVLGAKFFPGGLHAFVNQPVSAFTDRVLPLHEIFGDTAKNLDGRALAHTDHQAAIGVVETFLRGIDPRADDNLERVKAIAARIASDREIRTVEQLAAEFGIGMRTLQRLFSDYAGVSPKWMIRRYRLQEAAERMAAATALDWAQTALDLGYADQAHFVRDFKRLIGKSPADYFKALAELPRQ